ncbi:MAG: glutathione S-transferase family protein [Hyphomicrobiaceae bacterium]
MYRLIGRRGSGSMGPHLALEELGVPYAFTHVEKEHLKTPEFLKLNPMGRVPALILPTGEAMFESAAMVSYLAAAHPSELTPAPGTPAHARFSQWLVFLSANVYETYLRFFYSDRYTTDGEKGAAPVKAQALADLEKQFGIIEAALSPNLAGSDLTLADHYLYMLATWWDPAPAALLARHPKLAQLAKRLEARPAVAKVLKENA